jgi:hypothetical protein
MNISSISKGMSRPKRIASQKAQQKQIVDSDNELDLSEESDGDFSSASSDEYNPDKSKGNDETFEDSEDSESDDSDPEESESSPEKNNRNTK